MRTFKSSLEKKNKTKTDEAEGGKCDVFPVEIVYRQCTVLLYTHTQRETHTEEGINSAAIHYAPFLLWTKRGDSRGRSREREREGKVFGRECVFEYAYVR